MAAFLEITNVQYLSEIIPFYSAQGDACLYSQVAWVVQCFLETAICMWGCRVCAHVYVCEWVCASVWSPNLVFSAPPCLVPWRSGFLLTLEIVFLMGWQPAALAVSPLVSALSRARVGGVCRAIPCLNFFFNIFLILIFICV